MVRDQKKMPMLLSECRPPTAMQSPARHSHRLDR
jgi:hypothetical protein